MAATPLEYYDPNPSPTPSPTTGTGDADPTVGFGLTARHDDPDHGPSINEMHAVIEDGLLMLFGPEGDPVPPQSFAEMATREPGALVAMAGVGGVPVARIIDVLAAQAGASPAPGASDDWLLSMLGITALPADATPEELASERCTCELTAFGRDLMLTLPNGSSFLIAEAKSEDERDGSLFRGDGSPLPLADLLDDLRRQQPVDDFYADPGRSDHTHPFAECTLPGCGIHLEHSAVVLELPSGTVHLDAPLADGPRVSIFRANGEAAAKVDLVAALDRGDRTAIGAPSASPSGVTEVATAAVAAPVSAPVPAQLEWPLPPATLTSDGAVDLCFLADAVAELGVPAFGLTVAGVPEDGLLSGGLDQDDGSWSLAPEDLWGLTLLLPTGHAAPFDLEIAVDTVDQPVTGAIAVTPETVSCSPAYEPAPAADLVLEPAAEPAAAATTPPSAPEIPTQVNATVAAAPIEPIGVHQIPLALSAPEMDGDKGMAPTMVMIAGLPAGATLSAGIDTGCGSWTLTPGDLTDLVLTLPVTAAGTPLTLAITSVAIVDAEGEMAAVSEKLQVALPSEPEPQSDVTAERIALVIDPELVTVHEGNLDAVVVRDVPIGIALSAGTFDRSIGGWVLRPNELPDLAVLPAGQTEDFTVTVVGVSLSADGPARARVLTRVPVIVSA